MFECHYSLIRVTELLTDIVPGDTGETAHLAGTFSRGKARAWQLFM